MYLSICVITARAEPKLEWLLDALSAQARQGDRIELVVVDFFDRNENALLPDLSRVPGLRRVTISPPKPNPWQGRHRVTQRDLHAIANARNTAICLATYGYLAFLDDRVKLGPRWLEVVRRGYETQTEALCGPCDRDELGVGRIIDDRSRPGMDRRNAPPGWFYGGNFALPLSWLLEVNGCEEGTDPVGRQDRVLGHMLANQGRSIVFVPEMSVMLDRKVVSHDSASALGVRTRPFPRVNKGVPPSDKATALMRRFCERTRTEFTPHLRELRNTIAQGLPFPMHRWTADDLDWFDQQPIGKT